MTGVRLERLTKRYAPGATPAVSDLTLEAAENELLVLVGPSGCGKSTVLRMIAGLEEATSGEIRIGDRRVNQTPPRDRDIAMVFQNYALYPHLTVFENLAFGLRRRKVANPEVERRVGEAARSLGLERYLERLPRALSGGERQRVALGRAMVREPRVFLFDEPLSNLDAQLRVQMRAEIKRLHQRVRGTMIYVTHDQVEAMTLGDRIAVLRGGVLQQVADPFTLYERPANEFVASFIGSPPINRIEATLEGERVRVLERWFPLPAAVSARNPGGGSRAVTLGIRPEHLVVRGGGIEMDATADVVEPLGSEVLTYWTSPLGTLVTRTPGSNGPRPGDRATLGCDPGRIHLFDRESGDSLAADLAGSRAR